MGLPIVTHLPTRPLDNYPESNYPQCQKPSSSDGVCAIQYTAAAEDTGSCPNRRYAIDSYPSAEEAEAAGAVVTHGGACGVFSNLQDFSSRLANADAYETTTVLRAVPYAYSGNTLYTVFAPMRECVGLS
jgi:hypothetical protein